MKVVAFPWIFSKVRGAYEGAKEFVEHVIAEKMPEVIHATLNNGIPKVIREETQRVVDESIARHEVTERRELDARLSGFEKVRSRR